MATLRSRRLRFYLALVAVSVALALCLGCAASFPGMAAQAGSDRSDPLTLSDTPAATVTNMAASTPTVTSTATATATASRTPAPTTTATPTATRELKPALVLPLVMRNWCAPALSLTFVPPYGSFDNLQGRADCVNPSRYAVAVYIFVSGWWNKPQWATPLTSIGSDGVWTTDITTGGDDENAISIAAFLVPAGYAPPLLSGSARLPDALFTNAVAYTSVDREAPVRMIQFSGYIWQVKASDEPVGPGPNYFSDRAEDVFVDDAGRLHLRISEHNGRWYSSEVMGVASSGYGRYVFGLGSRVDRLDPNAVLGLFTWDESPEENNREIDIEMTRWSLPEGPNTQYVVQPWNLPGNRHQFTMTLASELSTHCFDWRQNQVQFYSLQGDGACAGAPGEPIQDWTYTGPGVPDPGGETPRINLWLYKGQPPSDGQPIEVIINKFDVVP